MSQRTNKDRRRFLGPVVVSIGTVLLGIAGCAKAQSTREVKLPVEGQLPSLGGATEWLNSQPLTAAVLRGKVVLYPISVHGPRNTKIKDR